MHPLFPNSTTSITALADPQWLTSKKTALTLILHEPPMLMLLDMPVEEVIGAVDVPVGVIPDITMLVELIVMSIVDIQVRATGRYREGHNVRC